MKKYYVIKMAYDDGFWSEEHQDFKGWGYATKYEDHPYRKLVIDDFLQESPINPSLIQATQKKPCCVVEIYDAE